MNKKKIFGAILALGVAAASLAATPIASAQVMKAWPSGVGPGQGIKINVCESNLVGSNEITTKFDPEQNGKASINITKYKLSADNGKAPGDGKDRLGKPSLGEKLPGAGFTVKKVKSINGTDISNLDYSTNEAFNTISKLVDSNNQPKGAVEFVDEGVKTDLTDLNGYTSANLLKFGVYQVSETTSPQGATPAAPFYVTVPMGTEKGYIYDICAYPKNAVDTVTKTVDDSKYHGVGDPISYSITTPVRPYENGIKRYVISDQLDSRLTFDKETLLLSTGVQLVKGEDYNITTENNKMVITFTNFDKLNAAAGFNTTLTTTVNTTFDSGDITKVDNKADLKPNQNPKWDDGTIPSNEVTSKFGGFSIVKKDSGDKTKTLSGAVFEVRTAKGDLVNFYDASGKKVTKTTTDGNGKASFTGLKLGEKYQLVEKTAPNGYAKLPKSIEVTASKLGANNVYETDLTVGNSKSSIFELPKTGKATVLYLSVIGLMLVVGSVALRNRSKKVTQK